MFVEYRCVYLHSKSPIKCVPIECKATTGNAKSMRTVLEHPEKYHVDFAIKLGDYNVGMKDKLLTLPYIWHSY